MHCVRRCRRRRTGGGRRGSRGSILKANPATTWTANVSCASSCNWLNSQYTCSNILAVDAGDLQVA